MRKKEHEERVKQQQDATKLQEQIQQQMQNMNMAMLQQQPQQIQELLTLLQMFADSRGCFILVNVDEKLEVFGFVTFVVPTFSYLCASCVSVSFQLYFLLL